MDPFVYRANQYRRVLDFDYDLRKVEAQAKKLYDGGNFPLPEIIDSLLQMGQFDDPQVKKSYDKMLYDGYIRFDIGKGHGILIFFEPTVPDLQTAVKIKTIIAS